MKRQTLEEYCQRYAMTEALRQAKEAVKPTQMPRPQGLAFLGQRNRPSRRGADRGQSGGSGSAGRRVFDPTL
jgi:hypothetical protein